MVLLVHGTRTRTEPLFTVRAFCGACVEPTLQAVRREVVRGHVYGVSTGEGAEREVRTCESCTLELPCDAAGLDREGADIWSGLRASERARLELDAFLRAQALLVRAWRWTPRSGAIALLVVGGAAALSWGTSTALGAGLGAALGMAIGMVPAAVLTVRSLVRSAHDREVALELAPRIDRFLARSGTRLRALVPRAKQLRLDGLVRVLEAVPPGHEGAGPYR